MGVMAHDGLTADMFHISAVCVYCKKQFFASDDWCYRDSGRYFCTYSHMQAWIREGGKARAHGGQRKKVKRTKITEEDRKEIIRLNKEECLNQHEIARRMNRNVSTISHIMREMRAAGLIDDMHYKRKRVTEEETDKIVELYSKGISGDKISQMIGRSKEAVYNALHSRGIWSFPDRMKFNDNREGI